jgi:hypothetical protein
MNRIAEKNLRHGLNISQYQGKQNFNLADNVLILSKNEKQKLKENDKISESQFIIMKEYATHLPRGKRELSLNMDMLNNLLVSTQLESTAKLTQTSGLAQGGLVGDNFKKKILLNQKEHLFRILNKNKLKTNPNPTSFKLNAKLS